MLIVMLHVEAETRVTLKRLPPAQLSVGELHWNVDLSQHATVFLW